ncbi:MAG: hypothetical protein HN544_01045 [Euryarchaeota archaeon]|nr:hypothetical protein [Euryarchaeota archaeon]
MSLEGVRGRVRATLTENQVSFESKSGHALDIKLDAVKRVHHHHTTLVPGWLAVVGLILMWVAWRGVTGKMQALLGAAGIVLSTAHYITRRPTLTIDTNADDCHTVFGPDIAMMRLCSLIQRIQNGMSLEDAKASVDAMVSDSEYPRYEITQELELIPEPVEILSSPVIPHFLDIMDSQDGTDHLDFIDAEIVSPAIAIDDLDLPLWEDEVEPTVQQMSPSLLSRSKEHMVTQRNQVIQNGWQQPEPRPVYNEVHRANHPGSSYGMINQGHYVQPPAPTQTPEPTPIPTHFLPSFVGANGVHVPGVQPREFMVPDSPLQAPVEPEPTRSLVASARKEDLIQATPVVEVQESQKERYPGVNKLSSKRESRRLISSRNGKKSRAAKKSILSELVKPIGRAGAFSRNFIKRRRTTDALRLQAEHSRQGQLASSIQELAKSNGGDVSDEEVSEMISHLSPPTVIPSSFSELVSTGSKNKGIEDVESIPRIED